MRLPPLHHIAPIWLNAQRPWFRRSAERQIPHPSYTAGETPTFYTLQTVHAAEFHLLIVAHAANANTGNAEGVAGSSAVRDLSQRLPVSLVTGPLGYVAAGNAPTPDLTAVHEPASGWLTRGVRKSKLHPVGLLARAVNTIRQVFGRPSLQLRAWANAAADEVVRRIDEREDATVVWARALPPASFEAAIRARRRRQFPLVVHFNDPMPHCLLWGREIASWRSDDPLQWRQLAWLRKRADAYTFPSRRLMELMARHAGFDLSRCFVIPHSPTDTNAPGPPPLKPDERPRILYAGTFYGSAFSEALRAGMALATRATDGPQFVLALKQPTDTELQWLHENLRHVEIVTNLSASDVADLARSCHAALVAQPAYHAPLARLKLADAVGARMPVLAVASPDSTTSDIVRRAGGLVIDVSSTPDDFAGGVAAFISELRDHPGWHNEEVIERTAPDRVARDLAAVCRFAQRRHNASGSQPVDPPDLERWP